MATTASKIYYPSMDDAFDPSSDMEKLARSVVSFTPIKTATERDSLPATSTAPYVSIRTDTGAVECSIGNGWKTIAGPPASILGVAAAGCVITRQDCSRLGDYVFGTFRITKSAGFSDTDTIMTMPSNALPAQQVVGPALLYGTGKIGAIRVDPDGTIHAMTGSSGQSGMTVIDGSFYYRTAS